MKEKQHKERTETEEKAKLVYKERKIERKTIQRKKKKDGHEEMLKKKKTFCPTEEND